MNVYLVPVGPDKHELYCEVPDEPQEQTPEEPDAPKGFFARMRQRFNETLAEAERARREGRSAEQPSGWFARVKAQTFCWIAESIAEQRLLWHLRRQSDACLIYPDDHTEADALAVMRQQLQRDFEKHRFWLIIDALGFIVSGLLALVPGPNILAYYFAFRLVGHYFSLRGARQGLSHIEWATEQSDALTELRRAINLAPDVRERRVHELALRLRLEHLATFFERTAVPMS